MINSERFFERWEKFHTLQTQQLFCRWNGMRAFPHRATSWPQKQCRLTKSQTGLTALLTHTDRCVCVCLGGGVWESLLVRWRWWEIANTTGLMCSFQGQAFLPHVSAGEYSSVRPSGSAIALSGCQRDYHSDIPGGFLSGCCDIGGLFMIADSLSGC